MVNASTRFADGFEFGLGPRSASRPTSCTRADPVGLEGLTTRKFVVLGHGEIRS
jgi:glutamate-5-semialdehyde dehydrogenase